MINTKYVALSRQMALWKQMDVVSNNMANVNTSGFKAEDTIFSQYVLQTPQAKGFGSNPVYFTQDFGAYKDFSEGTITTTGNALDMAIKGDGFFVVETQEGERYTRKGQFSLNSDGALVTNDGHLLLSENNEPFFFAPNEKDISISASGEIYATTTGDGVAQSNLIGKIKLVDFENPQRLLKTAGTLFENVAGNEIIASNAGVVQGAIEKSNVEGVVEMTKMIKLQRSYEYVQQMIDEEHTRLSNTISAFSQLA